VRVLVIDDSPTVTTYVTELLRKHPEVEVLPPARDGRAGIDAALSLKPDAIIMDLELPEVHGLDAIAAIMRERPCRILVLSAHVGDGRGGLAFDALRAGAVEIMAKPQGLQPEQIERFRRRLFELLGASVRLDASREAPPSVPPIGNYRETRELVVIGSSTGGLPVIREMLEVLPRPFPLPVVIAHHIMPGFQDGLCGWLSEAGHPVRVPEAGDRLSPGDFWMAPGGHDLTLVGNRAHLQPASPELPSPAVDPLFQSVARSYREGTVAVLLSGMGEDGAAGLKEIRDVGGLTIAQTPDTCLVPGMPEAAIQRAAAVRVLPPGECAGLLAGLRLPRRSLHSS
jgi:two-component system chemotaxis response regulator CheB